MWCRRVRPGVLYVQVRVENNGGLSVLFLSNVRPADSGNYTCAPSNARHSYINIHVLKGECRADTWRGGGTFRFTYYIKQFVVLRV